MEAVWSQGGPCAFVCVCVCVCEWEHQVNDCQWVMCRCQAGPVHFYTEAVNA